MNRNAEMTVSDVMVRMIEYSRGNLHDIVCPLCREKYGSTDGKRQETEDIPLAEVFLADSVLLEVLRERVAFSHRTVLI